MTELYNDLNAFNSCEVVPAKNEDVVVLVTETFSKEEEQELLQKIQSLPSLKSISMVSGFNNN